MHGLPLPNLEAKENVFRTVRGIEKMNMTSGLLCEDSANHRADGSYRRALRDKDSFRVRGAVNREGAKRTGKVEHIPDVALEQMCDSGATGNAIEADLEWLAIFRARRNRVGPHAHFAGKRDRN